MFNFFKNAGNQASLSAFVIIFLMSAVVFLYSPMLGGTNEGPHGKYTHLTEKCALCHRPHTAALSKILKGENVFDLNANSRLDISDFCFSCHKDGAGANNNVYGGYFMGYSGPGNPAPGTTDITYNPWPGEPTNTINLGVRNAGLNGGGFVTAASYTGFSHRCSDPPSCTANSVSTTTSYHNALDDQSTYTLWASGSTGPGYLVNITCASCHNPHGNANYRLLRHNGKKVSTADPNPNPWPANGSITSWETEFGGTRTKDYTTFNYKTSFSRFCTSCHTQYLVDLGIRTYNTGTSTFDVNERGTYDAGDGAGAIVRYKHPIDIPIASWDFYGTKSIPANLTANMRLPLAQTTTFSATVASADQLTCLTCHQVHGTNSTVTSRISNWPLPTRSTTGSAPGYSNLKRLDNRGECEDCHGW